MIPAGGFVTDPKEPTGTGATICGVAIYPHGKQVIVKRLVHPIHVAVESVIVAPPSADLSPTVELLARGDDVPNSERYEPGSRHYLPPYIGVEMKIRGEVLLVIDFEQLVAGLVYDEKEFLTNDTEGV